MFEENLVLSLENVKTKQDVFEEIAQNLKKQNYINDTKNLVEKLNDREELSSTGFEHGIAIPHAKIKDLKDAIVVIAKVNISDWPSLDNDATTLALVILVPDTDTSEHLNILSKLSAKLINTDFVEKLKEASDSEKIALLKDIEEETKPDPVTINNESTKYFVAVTGCTTGIAHTFMAAEALRNTASEMGYDIKVETRGQNGVENKITQSDLDNAEAVIVAADVDVDVNRFAGYKVLQKPVKAALSNTSRLFDEAEKSDIFEPSEDGAKLPSAYKALLNGVTHMLPFTIAGGILTALRFFFGTQVDIDAGVEPVIELLRVGEFCGQIGGLLFSMMIPVLGAYIAQSIGRRPGLMMGFLAGLLAVDNGSGFVGAIIGGFFAGYLAYALIKYSTKVPQTLQGITTILFIPLIGAIIVGLFMTAFGVPIAWLNTALQDGLLAIQDFSPFLLGAIIGLMMAADLGGPINKAAYVTGTLLLSEGNETFIAAVMAGGMAPPIAISLSALVKPNLYEKEDRGAAYTNIILGLSFVTEGAIPFASINPLKVIPSLMAGSAVAGALTMLFRITLPAPHGGVFVFPLVNSPLLYGGAIIIGAIVSAVLLIILNPFRKVN